MSITEQIKALMLEAINHPEVNKAAGADDGYRSAEVSLAANYCGGNRFEFAIYPGGNFNNTNVVIIRGNSFEDVYKKISGYDPDEARKREINELEAKLAELKGGVK